MEQMRGKEERICAVKYCYNLLDSIEKCENDAEVQLKSYRDEFIKTFNKTVHIDEDSRVFFDSKVLNDTFKGHSENIPVTIEVPEEDVRGETLLFRALSKYNVGNRKLKKGTLKLSKKTDTRKRISFDKDAAWIDIIEHIIETVPDMITFYDKKNVGECVGYSPLYLAIVKKHNDVIGKMIKRIKEYKKQNPEFDVPLAKGSTFGDTVMLAGTPLGVAALTMDKSIFRKVLQLYNKKDGFKLVTENSKKDNIIHSMIKYIQKNKDQLRPAKEMLSYILDSDSWKITSHKPEETVKHLAMSKNAEHLTPLQLGAKRQQFELFEIIIQSKSYHLSDYEDGLITLEKYDITELETIAIEDKTEDSSDEYVQKVKHFSVLEFVYLQRMQTAFRFADLLPVRKVIKKKWSRYRLLFYPWFILHLIFMCLLTWVAVKRSSLQFPLENETGDNPVKYDANSKIVSIIGCSVGACIFLLVLERLFRFCCCKRFGARIKASFIPNIWRILSTLPYTNQTFEVFFFLFAFTLILDIPLAFLVSDYGNESLVFAVMIGWYLVLFFIQVFRRLSFFTVLIQRVIKDMFNFAIVMGFLLIGFTVAMFMVMQGSSPPNEDFSSFWKTLLKMFTVMLGIGEIGDMFNARNPVMAIIVFVLFVLLTTILLLNALIAMMSNSYTELMDLELGISKVSKMHEILQKLSVIIFLESYLPKCLCREIGEKNGEDEEIRRILKIPTMKPSENEGETEEGNEIYQGIQNILSIIPRQGQNSKNQRDKGNAVADQPTSRNTIIRPSTLDITEYKSWEQRT